MSFEHAAGLALVAALLGYLVFALLRPEKL